MKRTLFGAERSIYRAIRAFQTGPVDGPTGRQIANYTGYGAKSVLRILDQLRDSGLIDRAVARDRSYLYFVRDWKPGEVQIGRGAVVRAKPWG